MSLMKEYIDKKAQGLDLLGEVSRLIGEYNKLRKTYLFVYAAANGKPIPDLALSQSDYYVIHDLLVSKKGAPQLDFYIETPGGSGNAAEEIVKFLRSNFGSIYFLISGEAKSAGTIMALSGDDILMTETGSLGPIDAQVTIGRSVQSAYDYMEWVEQTKEKAEKDKKLNPFDAIMVAQITPGELGNVNHALNFAKDLVIEWLSSYKFKNWNITENQKIPVTDDMKRAKAKDIADSLCNHARWRLHGRSIKINDLEDIGLRITKVDNDAQLSDIVHRIQIVLKLIFDSSTTFKIFMTADNKITRSAVSSAHSTPINTPSNSMADAAQFEHKCPNCGKIHKIYGKFVDDKQIDIDSQKEGYIPFPNNDKINCECGFEVDLTGIKNHLEMQTGKILIKEG